MSGRTDIVEMKRRLALRKQLQADNKTWPARLTPVPVDTWPRSDSGGVTLAIWRSRHFLVTVIDEGRGAIRLTINRTELDRSGDWAEGITWCDLQRLKSEAGYGDQMAVEIFPADGHVVDVANMRHLWILPVPLPFAWSKRAI